jgi:LysR family glycine cleavage system transcriptional activator
MSARSRRPLSLTNLRAFEAVARTLNFGTAAEELHVTQSAVSRQIKGLEDELGAQLFVRGTRHVQISPDGHALLRAVEPLLLKLDATVQTIRRARGRQRVSVATFASFASLWLLPRVEAFQREHADIDIRVSAHDAVADLEQDTELDLALRYLDPAYVGAGAVHLFGETLTPVVSRSLWDRVRAGGAPPLARPADVAQHTLLEEDDDRASSEFLSWRHWLARQNLAALEPKRWLSLTYTYQQVQAALAGHGIALARLPLVFEAIARGELVEPFGDAGRIESPYSYWMVLGSAARARPEVARVAAWIEAEAERTRAAVGAAGAPALASARRAR